MNNIFGFDYRETKINNDDETPSRFSYITGAGGMVVHTKKDSYKIIETADISKLADKFIEAGYNTSRFIHNNGEVIGLNMTLGNKPTNVGEKFYYAILTIPNQGGGVGFLNVGEKRLTCRNGAVRIVKSINGVVKIPHTIDYQWYIKTVEESVLVFQKIVAEIERQDAAMDDRKLESEEVMFHLNKWFFDQEFPPSQKGDMSFEEFRRLVFESPNDIKCIDRYNQLRQAYQRELVINEELKLDLSMYTVFASVTNYLSRRAEASKTKAPAEIKLQRDAEKLKYFEAVV